MSSGLIVTAFMLGGFLGSITTVVAVFSYIRFLRRDQDYQKRLRSQSWWRRVIATAPPPLTFYNYIGAHRRQLLKRTLVALLICYLGWYGLDRAWLLDSRQRHFLQEIRHHNVMPAVIIDEAHAFKEVFFAPLIAVDNKITGFTWPPLGR